MLQIQKIYKKYVTGDLEQTALDGVSLNLRDNEVSNDIEALPIIPCLGGAIFLVSTS